MNLTKVCRKSQVSAIDQVHQTWLDAIMAAIHPIAYEKHIIGTSVICTQVCIFWYASTKFGIDHHQHPISVP